MVSEVFTVVYQLLMQVSGVNKPCIVTALTPCVLFVPLCSMPCKHF